ncbi:AmmeMemoRadiSam system protein B [Candidatus Uhrbacteria bacterium]|nr:AmmeMemoRadiSam system protein B [Candidatus Uhrbacteria bacterium]
MRVHPVLKILFLCFVIPVGVVGVLIVGVVAPMVAVPVESGRVEAVQPSLTPRISGIVVPHHEIVGATRTEMFRTIGARYENVGKPETIVLIGPNHFERGIANIQTTRRSWNTSVGILEPDVGVIDALASNKTVREEPKSFNGEHSIYLIVRDIKQTFPDARIVPIIVKMETPQEEVTALADALNGHCPACLVVASVDFSHYQPAALADLHDRLTLRALVSRDSPLLMRKAEVDAPAVLSFLATWAVRHDTKRFVVFDHTNSGVIIGNSDAESTSHMFGWYEEGEPAAPEPSVSFAFAGDIILGRAVGYWYEQDSFRRLFSDFGNRVFWGVDAPVANLEGPISDMPLRSNPKANNVSFNFSPQGISALRYLKLGAVSLANNHTLNQGANGLLTTRTLLRKQSICPIGDPREVKEQIVCEFQGQNLKLSIIGVNVLSHPKQRPIIDAIRELKKNDASRVIVFPHWGVEYQPKHSPEQEQLAKQWIDAGADAVIGAHPHVIQDIGVYQGKPIVYSLGNFVFDQTFSKETQQGLIVAGEFTDKGLSLVLLGHESVRAKPRLLRGKDKKKIIDTITSGVAPYRQNTPFGTAFHFPASQLCAIIIK